MTDPKQAKAEHTKGPWHWDADEYGFGTDGIKRWRYRVVALGRTIMQTYYTEEQRGQAEADTRLASLAPELLALVERWLIACDLAGVDAERDGAIPDNPSLNPYIQLLRDSRAAIAGRGT